jgi:hypothetical protein
VRFSRRAKNRMRFYGLSKEEVEDFVTPQHLFGLDGRGHPVFLAGARENRLFRIVIALDAPDFVITVYEESK